MSGIQHEWPRDAREAAQLQRELSTQVSTRPYARRIRRVAGVDVSFTRGDDRVYGGVVVLSFPELELVDEAWAVTTDAFPYIPGLLSFRELPVVLEAFDKLSLRPDLVICDGQGLAHPRRFGIACHLGLWLGVPTVGCAKSRLIGDAEEPGQDKGDASPLSINDEQVGYLLRTRSRVKPVYVSPGYGMSTAQARDSVLACTTRYRLPETTRHAHNLVNRVRRQELTSSAI